MTGENGWMKRPVDLKWQMLGLKAGQRWRGGNEW